MRWRRAASHTRMDKRLRLARLRPAANLQFNPMKKQLIALSIVAAASLLLQGCVALVAGAAAGTGVAYFGGELKSNEPVSIDKAWSATEKAVTAMEFKPVSKKKDSLAAQYEVIGAADKRVTIKLKNTGDKVTEVRIRVGTFGDESFSRTILTKIQSNY